MSAILLSNHYVRYMHSLVTTCLLQHDQTLPLSAKDVACDPNYCYGTVKTSHASSFSREAVYELYWSCVNSLHECDEKVKFHSRQFLNGCGNEASDHTADNGCGNEASDHTADNVAILSSQGSYYGYTGTGLYIIIMSWTSKICSCMALNWPQYIVSQYHLWACSLPCHTVSLGP